MSTKAELLKVLNIPANELVQIEVKLVFPVTESEEKRLHHERALYTVTEARNLLSLSDPKMRQLLKSGQLRSFGEGKSRRIPAGALDEFIKNCEDAEFIAKCEEGSR